MYVAKAMIQVYWLRSRWQHKNMYTCSQLDVRGLKSQGLYESMAPCNYVPPYHSNACRLSN
jgi:hypothetical protein